MEVYLSDFSQGNIRAYVTEDKAHNFLVKIPDYHLSLTITEDAGQWKCTRNSGIYNPVWVKEIAYQLLRIH